MTTLSPSQSGTGFGFGLAQVLAWTSGRCANAERLGDSKAGQIRVTRANRLGRSRAGDIAFFFSRHYESELATASPSILILGEAFLAPLEAARGQLPGLESTALVVCQDPYLAMAIVLEQLAPVAVPSLLSPGISDLPAQIHPTAVIDPSARLGRGVRIGPFCTVGEGSVLGDGVELVSHISIGPRVTLGRGCKLFSFVTIYENCTLGDRVRLHSGVVIGADGFGYAPERGASGLVHRKILHVGRVQIDDDVEIGANTCVDRATVGETHIGRGAKIDNEVQIGHNVEIGEGAIVCGKAGLSGSSSVGKYAYIGGAVGLANQVHVGDGARIGGMSLVSKDIPPGETWVGNPARRERDHFRVHALLNKLVHERRGRS